MKNVKIEWCENFIKSVFKKHVPFENGGIETGCFWSMAERSGLWERGTYGTPMSSAKEKLKQAMDDHGDTNKALAVFLGMTASNFSTIWNGRQPFQRKHIVRIAVRYQLSPQDVWDIFFLADAEAIKKEAREA